MIRDLGASAVSPSGGGSTSGRAVPPGAGRSRNVARWASILGFSLLVVGYLLTSPPWAAPDEAAVHLRALAADQLGVRPAYGYPAQSVMESWYRTQTRQFDVPATLAPPAPVPCYAFDTSKTADCLGDPRRWGDFGLSPAERLDAGPDFFFAGSSRLNVVATPSGPRTVTSSYTGAYPPFGLVVPGLVARLGHSPQSSLLLGRAGAAVMAVGLSAVAILLFGGGVRVAGPVLAMSPMVVFLEGTMSPSGLETAGALAVAAALAALFRPGPPRYAWAVLFLGAAALACARPLGPLWLTLAVGGCFAVARAPVRRQVLQSRPRWAVGALTGVVLLGTANVAWVWINLGGAPSSGYSPARKLSLAVSNGKALAREIVGVLGWLDTPVPNAVVGAWWGLVAMGVLLAFVVGTARQRVALLAVVAALAVTIIAVSIVFALGQPGTRAQGRWFLPVVIGLPLLAAEIVARRLRPPLARRLAAVGVTAVVAACQVVAFVVNAHRYALGNLDVGLDLGGARWTPYGGWALWMGVALVAGTAILLSGLSADDLRGFRLGRASHRHAGIGT